MKNKLYILILLLFGNLYCIATQQVSDILILNKDTLDFRVAPITYDRFNDTCLLKYNQQISSACWDGFFTTWIVKNDSLFINDIKTCSGSKSYFNEYKQCKDYPINDSLIFAKNMNSDYWCEFGGYIDIDIHGPLYHKHESKLTFENGILKNQANYIAKEYYDPDSINKYIAETVYNNIDWDIFNKENIVRQTIKFELYIDSNGKVKCGDFTNLYVEQKLKQQILEILTNMKDWNKYYYSGKVLLQSHYVEIYFDKNIMNKYAR